MIVTIVDSAVAFCTDLPGFTPKDQYGPAMAIVTRDDLTLWLAGPLASASKPMPDGAQPKPGGWNPDRATGGASGGHRVAAARGLGGVSQ